MCAEGKGTNWLLYGSPLTDPSARVTLVYVRISSRTTIWLIRDVVEFRPRTHAIDNSIE
jgi:hypothetical protein